ncbi:MAG: glycosyltransferase family 2 protein [Deltaproteobacteria bacterium]|nr:MAG: glycosyltransferase family 2 protein [Deltaproteobacteria bacterium]
MGGMKIAAVIVNRNRPRGTLEAVESLRRGRVVPERIVVVDNGESDPALQATFGKIPGIVSIAGGGNHGFGGGNNVALRAFLPEFETFFFLNDDARVMEDTLLRLTEAISQAPDVGIVGSTLLDAADPDRLHAAHGIVNHRQVVACLAGAGAALPEAPAGPPRAVDFVLGCGMLVKRSVFERIGLFDAHLFLYHEDLDLCLRAWRAGFRVLHVPAAKVLHEISASSRGAEGERVRAYFLTRNAFLVMDRHGRFHDWMKFLLFVALDLIVKAPMLFSPGDRGVYLARLSGFAHGFSGGEDPPFVQRFCAPLPLIRRGIPIPPE